MSRWRALFASQCQLQKRTEHVTKCWRGKCFVLPRCFGRYYFHWIYSIYKKNLELFAVHFLWETTKHVFANVRLLWHDITLLPLPTVFTLFNCCNGPWLLLVRKQDITMAVKACKVLYERSKYLLSLRCKCTISGTSNHQMATCDSVQRTKTDFLIMQWALAQTTKRKFGDHGWSAARLPLLA